MHAASVRYNIGFCGQQVLQTRKNLGEFTFVDLLHYIAAEQYSIVTDFNFIDHYYLISE